MSHLTTQFYERSTRSGKPRMLVQCSAAEPEPVLTDTEQKLLRLGLDPAARGNEVDTSGAMLLKSWRRRQVQPEEIIGPLAKAPARADRALEMARRRVMPFGKHRGRQLEAIEPSYLRWALRECSNLSLGLREAITLVLSASRRN